MVLIFSFDQAIRNLGLCVLKIEKGSFNILKLDTWDMLSDKYNYKNQPTDVTSVNLKNNLRQLDTWQQENHPNEQIIVLTEFIFRTGVIAATIGHMIVYHYSGEEDVKIYEKVPPAQKNQICLGPEYCKYYNFAEKYTKAYDANKAHSAANFLWYCNKFPDKLPQNSNDINYKISKIDDIADAFMQALAMIRFGKINVTFNSENDILIKTDESHPDKDSSKSKSKSK